ncbi:hypothetical protein JCM11491_004084 [Sporobolomyces phaffii]
MSDGEQTDDYKEYKARQVRAQADPLEIGVELAWTGPSLEPGVRPPLDYPHSRSTSPNPLRPVLSQLLDPLTGVDTRPWTLALVEPLKTGTCKYSQVWRAEANPAGDSSLRLPVVVKLFQESLMPFPRGESQYTRQVWRRVADSIKNESQAYRLAQDAQGSDVPLCYGFYTFSLPSKEKAIGVILEDLVHKRQGIALDKFLRREAKGNRLTFDLMDRIMSAALRLQNRLHLIGLADILHTLDQLIVLHREGSDLPTVVGLGFSESSSKAEVDQSYEAGDISVPRWRWRWNKADQNQLFGSMDVILDDVSDSYEAMARKWEKVEKERKMLDFLCQHEVIVPPAEDVKPIDRHEEEQDRQDRLELHLLLGGRLEELS